MKFNFFKIRKVQVYLLVTTMLLCVSACAFSSFDCYAESSDVKLEEFYSFNISSMGISNFWNSSDFENSSLYNSNAIIRDGANTFIFSELSLLLDGNDSNDELKLPQTFNISSVDYSLDDFPYFLITYDGSNWYYNVYLFDTISGVFNSFGSSSCDIVTSSDVTCVCFTFDSNCSLVNSAIKTPNNNWSGLSVFQLGDYCVSNFPICSIDSSKLNDTWLKSEVLNGSIAYWYCLAGLPYQDTSDPVQPFEDDFGNYDELFIDNINYIITDCNNGVGYTNPITNENYSEDAKEDILNHMTLDDATTKFYLTSDSFNNGTLYMYLGTDEYQQENVTDYTVRIVATSSYSCTKYDNAYRKITYKGKDITTYFPMTSLNLNTFDFYLGSNNQQYYDIPLANFVNNENTLSLSDINKNCHCSSGVDQKLNVLAGALDNTYSGANFWKQVEQTAFNFGVSNVLTWRFNLNELDMPDFEVVPTSASYHFDLYLYNSEIDELSSVQCYGDANLVTGSYEFGNLGTSTEQDKMNALNSDYVPSDYMSTNSNTNYGGTLSNGGSASSSSSPSVSPSISGGENSINIVNNNTNNGGSGTTSTNESSFGTWSITTLLIKYIAGGKNSGVSYIEDLAGTNTYLSIVSNYMSFVPTEIWSLVITTFTVCLGCVVVAFIISIVIKIIT